MIKLERKADGLLLTLGGVVVPLSEQRAKEILAGLDTHIATLEPEEQEWLKTTLPLYVQSDVVPDGYWQELGAAYDQADRITNSIVYRTKPIL